MTTTEKLTTTPTTTTPDKPEGPISAAILAAGAGALTLGILTTLAEANADINAFLRWNDRVGPLSGKTSLTVIIWLVIWAVLHLALRRRSIESTRALTVALVLITLGVIGTFPLFFQLFG
jgi:hypothetical protein